MSTDQLNLLLEDITSVRAQMRASPRLQLEFKAMVSKLLREYNVGVRDETLSSITIAVYPELSSASVMVEGPLPVPDQGPAPW